MSKTKAFAADKVKILLPAREALTAATSLQIQHGNKWHKELPMLSRFYVINIEWAKWYVYNTVPPTAPTSAESEPEIIYIWLDDNAKN